MKIIMTKQEVLTIHFVAIAAVNQGYFDRSNDGYTKLKEIVQMEVGQTIVMEDGYTIFHSAEEEYILIPEEVNHEKAMVLIRQLAGSTPFWNAFGNIFVIVKSLYRAFKYLKPAMKTLEKVVIDEYNKIQKENEEKNKDEHKLDDINKKS